MPNIESAKKALRQSVRRRARNLRRKRVMKDVVKEIRKLADAGKTKEAIKLLPQAYKAIDKTATQNIIKKNTAARKKSKLTKYIEKVTK